MMTIKRFFYMLVATAGLMAACTANDDNPSTNPVDPSDKTPAGVEAVDMGMPSGTKWANMNVGASKSEDYGDYYAWGETAPYYQEGYAQEDPCTHWTGSEKGYHWANYSFVQPGSNDFYMEDNITKYTFDDGWAAGIWYDGDTFIGDGKRSFAEYGYADDVARQKWGGNWRTPTEDEWKWLRNNCTWTWTQNYNGTGINGMIVTSKITGFENSSIFLPAAGIRFDEYLEDVGVSGRYWSSSLDKTLSYYACSMNFYILAATTSVSYRYYGYSIRPVR